MNNRVNVKGDIPILYPTFCFARGGETFLTHLPQTKHMEHHTAHTVLPRVGDCSELMRAGKGQ